MSARGRPTATDWMQPAWPWTSSPASSSSIPPRARKLKTSPRCFSGTSPARTCLLYTSPSPRD
eukprot:12740497-Alexandrium_andersonii.AAC.1